MTKQELRKLYLQKRKELSEAEYLALNQRLADIFFSSVDLSFIKVIHVYLPVIEKREPDTWLIIDRIRREFPHIRLSIPKINSETNRLDNFFFEGLHQLKKNDWGILEPQQGIPTPVEKIDLVLVPLLAFDKHGHRVGYGKGYYDKFLKTLHTNGLTLGISLFAAEEGIDDIQSNDVPLKSVITPHHFYTFSQH
jgi:5-formyltetrahydrofolate cyclo-ligase